MTNDIPVMLYDSDCGFCVHWIEKWRKATGAKVAYEPYQKVLGLYPQLNEAQCRASIQLVMPNRVVFSGAQAVFKALQIGEKCKGLFWSYEHIPFFAAITEWCYRRVAHNRMFFSKLFSASQCKL
jgi:predicted DCC family thiol-disulfide oxidoreductase YuxK